MSGSPLLEARGIRKRFGGVEALKGVDFAVAPGRVHALLGENGAGKSTLVKLLGGALVPDAGEIRWRGAPVVLKSPGQARDLGIRTIHYVHIFRRGRITRHAPVAAFPAVADLAAAAF